MERSVEVHVKRSNKGTSARTRPFSFDEIMLRRREKLAEDAKGGIEASALSEKVDDEGDGWPDAIERNKSIKVSNDAEKGSSKRIEAKDKGRRELANTKVKSTHSKSSREKEHRNVKPGHHKSSATDRLVADSEREHEKKRSKGAVENNKHEERDTKSKKERRKHPSHIDEKGRSDNTSYYSKKHDLGRGDRKKDHSPPYNDERRSKRRRSRSPQYDRERERSLSVSPRIHKRSYHGRDYGDSSYQSSRDKSRRSYMDTEKNRADTVDYASEHQWKHGSGLGGYSPRKRKTEAAVKTPSPTIRSPERKVGTWDQPPDGTSNAGSASMLANIQSPVTMVPEVVSSVPVTPATTIPQPVLSIDNAKILLNPSTDSVQLTQATRPMRRIYIENLPPSASDKTVVDCFNDFLMLPGVNYIQRIKPCINCIINKEKSQALVEFLTPEDATQALSFDGRSLSGSILKIRRPKDYVEAATGAPEKPLKPVTVTKTISDVVTDTPHKIFVGGISKVLSSDMLMEIVSVFGLLRSYHFEFNKELRASTAFLEYADHSNTTKACAGLNGIKLGGRVLTAVRAIPDHHHLEKEAGGATVSYVIPDHAKPLLADPTPVLQLKSLFDRDELLLLSEAELDEVLEDVRLECARFGTVKSVNIVRYGNNSETATEVVEQNLNGESCKMEAGAETDNIDSNQNGDIQPMEKVKGIQNVIEDEAVNNPTNLAPVDTTVSEEPLNLADASGSPPACFNIERSVKSETYDSESVLVSDVTKLDVGVGDSDLGVVGGVETKREGERAHDVNTDLNTTDDAAMSGGDFGANGQAGNPSIFEVGCVLVEYSRAEASCTAAHCLHGRLFGEKIVVVGYVPHDLYLARFPR